MKLRLLPAQWKYVKKNLGYSEKQMKNHFDKMGFMKKTDKPLSLPNKEVGE